MAVLEKAMILAAGFGERARPLSLVRPKPLFPVLNRPLISYTVDRLARAGVHSVLVNTHHLAGRLESYLAGLETGLEIKILREKVILGTGGGVKNAARFLGPNPFILINADIWTEIDMSAVVKEHLTHGPLATLVLHKRPEISNVAVDENSMIRGFRGHWPAGRLGPELRILAFTGIHVVDPEVLSRIPDGPGDIIEVYQAIIRDGGPIRAIVADRPAWRDAGTLEDYLALHADLMADRADGPIMAGPGVEIRSGAALEGWACLDEGVVIERGAQVENSALWPGARVGPGVRVINSVLADGAVATDDVINQAVAGEATRKVE